jgi:hypothetical protein
MKYIGVLITAMFAGCAVVPTPVAPTFPDPPEAVWAREACPALKQLNEDAKLSDISNVIKDNYQTYYECAVKLDQWLKWYPVQREIFERATKK